MTGLFIATSKSARAMHVSNAFNNFITLDPFEN
jgi:hypothetical protein